MTLFRWEEEQEFLALVNLLCLRNGGQLEDVEDEDDEEPQEDDVDSDDADTVRPHLMSGNDEGDLKRRFLDRLAEIISRDKGAKEVSCAALQEGEASVTLHVSRNEGFSPGDEQFCKELANALQSISRQGDADSMLSKQTLWKEMLKYNSPRLRYYIDNLKRRLRDCKIQKSNLPTWQDVCPLWDHSQPFCEAENIGDYSKQTHDSYMAFAWKQLDELTRLVNDRMLETGALVDKAYALRHLKSLNLLLTASSLSASFLRKLMSNIVFLGRLRSAYCTFLEVAHSIDYFRNITIVLAVVPQPRSIPHTLLNFSQALKCVGLAVNKGTIQKYINANWTVRQAETKYIDLRRRPRELPTHAEVQLVLHLAGVEPKHGRVFPYIGCSKLSCFLCAAFLRSHSATSRISFKTKGCHGKVYTLWTIPDDFELSPAAASIISSSAIALKKHLKQELQKPVRGHGDLNPESTAGYTIDDAGAGRGSIRSPYMRQLEIDQTWDREFRVIQSYWFSSQTSVASPLCDRFECDDITLRSEECDSETEIEEEQDPALFHAESTTYVTNECSNCQVETSRKCSRCNKIWLCSEACERKYSSPSHDFPCAIGRPLDSADYLYMACLRDVMPDNQDTLDDFRFSNFLSAHDRMMLLRIYTGLLLYFEVDHRELNQWRLDGTLVEKTMQQYQKIPVAHRGGYLPWLIQNQHILESLVKSADSPEASFKTFVSVAVPYLDPDDKENFCYLEPEAKRMSFLLYALVLQGWSPNPDFQEELYFRFGFCTCTTDWNGPKTSNNAYAVAYDREESELTFLYEALIFRCTFQEFWTAFASNKLIHLFDANNLGTRRRRFRHLEAVLNVELGGYLPTVWYLNHFVNTESTRPTRCLLADYGFVNCRTGPEILDLKNVYATLLAHVDPMDVHRACLKGELYEFASRIISLRQKYRRLMKNPYPLPFDVPWSGMGTSKPVTIVIMPKEVRDRRLPFISALSAAISGFKIDWRLNNE